MSKKIFNAIVLLVLLLPTKLFAQVTQFDIHTVGDNYKYTYQETPPVMESIVPYTNGYSSVRWEYSSMPLSGFVLAPGTNNTLSYTYPTFLQNTTFFRRIITINYDEFISNTIKLEVVSIHNENLNYIREHNVLVPNQTQWTSIDQLAIGDKLQITTYLDNLGRPLQKVAKGVATPNLPATEPWGDVVQFSVYDELSRKPKNYLPYTTLADPGKFKTNTIADQANYYFTNYNETAPYSKVTYNNSPLNTATRVNAPGTSWEASAGSTANFLPSTAPNSATSEIVPIYRIGYAETDQPIFSGLYGAGQLIVTTGIDENGKKVVEYINKSGQVILKKVQLDDAPAGFYDGWICTFNIYDDFGQLRLQAQPEAVKWLSTHNFSFDGGYNIIQDLCFVYSYDSYGRNTYKKNPGAKPLYMVYSNIGQTTGLSNSYGYTFGNLAFTQDGNQRAKPIPEWTYYQYDGLNRPMLTALYNTTRTRQDIITSAIVPYNELNSLTILKENYYDDYTYPNVKPFATNFENAQAGSIGGEPIATTKRTSDMPTGSKVRVLGTSTFLISTIYYDERGRPIQSTEDNINQGTDQTTMEYSYSSRLLNIAQKHTSAGTPYVGYGIITKYGFDKLGRVTDIYKKFGTNAFKHIGNYAYDDVGRIKKKRLYPGYTGTGKTEIETLNYTYNIHNSLTGINKGYALKQAGLNKWDHFFGMYLGYDNRDGEFANTNLNGQVTGVMWSTQGDDEQRKYDYTYDNVGRLTNAVFKQKKGTVWANDNLDFSVSGHGGKIQYDLNGNILAMLQRGVIVGNLNPVNLDDLEYGYAANSNKLISVTDNSTAGNANGKLGDFADGANFTDDYVYDDNGNLIVDLNKNVQNQSNAFGAGITYNYLDKPEQIRLAGKGTITIKYDANGSKLQKTYTPDNTSIPPTTTTYISSFVYKNNSIQYINFEEGRLRILQPTSNNNGYDNLTIQGTENMPDNKKGVYDFFIKDYQSNVRMVLTDELHIGSNLCTMETSRAANEEPIFGKTDANGVPVLGNEVQARFPTSNIPGQSTGNGWTNPTIANHVVKLFKGRRSFITGTDMGPGSLLKVMAGDKVSATTIYYYQTPVTNTTSNTSALTSILNSLTVAIGSNTTSASVTHGPATNITNNLSSNVQFVNATSPNAGDPTGTNPKAYLTVLFFDERFNFVAEGSSAARVQGAGNGQAPLVLDNIQAPKNGYVYIYLSNESTEPVYFDNLRVVHNRGHITEENHYYAYGLKIAALSSTKAGDVNEGELKNRRKYQGAFAEYDEDIQWNEFALRDYDPQIARWVQQDPYQQFASPYVALGGDPVNMIDPSGGWSLSALLGVGKLGVAGAGAIVGALVGGAAGMANGDKNASAKGAIIGAFAGLSASFMGGGGSAIGQIALQAVIGGGKILANEAVKIQVDPTKSIPLNLELKEVHLKVQKPEVKSEPETTTNSFEDEEVVKPIEEVVKPLNLPKVEPSVNKFTKEAPDKKFPSGYSIKKAVKKLEDHASPKSLGLCARYVRIAIEAGGQSTNGRPLAAADYVKFLPKIGFEEINSSVPHQKGDIVVFQRTGGRKWGHIAMYNGSQWISDFRQRSIIVHTDYKNSSPRFFRRSK
jgi:RHS repeat-associated protein